MADSFADLWNSTAPTKPPEPPRKLGSLTPIVSSARPPQNDVFSMLASASPSTRNSRSNTPSATGPLQSTRSLGTSSPAIPKPVQKSTSAGGDAFSSLLAGPFASSSTSANMTIAERAAKAERERKEQSHGAQTVSKHQVAAWAGLDSLGTTSFGAKSSSATALVKIQDDEWDFVSAPSKTQSVAEPPPPADVDLFDEFLSQPAPLRPAPSQAPQSILDLDEFTSPSVLSNFRHSPERPTSRINSPGDFDFGDREDALLDDDSNDEDDILGALSKPVDARAQPPARSVQDTPQSSQVSTSGQRSRAVSPPPHIVGQIVEMGFSPEQARIALAATDTGLDVQTALESLLAAASNNGTQTPSREAPRGNAPRRRRERYEESDEDEHDEDSSLRRRQAPSKRGGPARPPREPPARDGPSSSPAGASQHNLQEQADKLLAQASEIGLNVFNRANAFWKEGREKVQRAYEERAAAAASAKAPTADKARNARPKWMQDVPEHAHVEGIRHDCVEFSDEPEVLPPGPSSQTRPRKLTNHARPAAAPAAMTTNLLSEDAPAMYVSPFRRRIPAQVPSTPPVRPPSPVKLIQRKAISASPTAIAASAKHKAAGTEMFKLGRYVEAETSYSAAIAALPESHLLLIPLYNNRALTRIKTGEHTGAIEDCTNVISIIGLNYHPAREEKVTKEDEGAGIDLADGLMKAFRRRAEAYEGKEKWDLARQDWETIAAAEWAAKTRGEAVRGAGRCRRMLSADVDTLAPTLSAPASRPPSQPKRKPKPQPVQRRPTPTSEALNRVRAANQAAEAEDQQRYELKDVVDSRLAAWKNGKELNIRALIASLDTVLWPDLGWQKVGMHELVTPSQVKIRYTKAIAKLHPDKLSVNNTTLEQRMIANGVFGSLNDAWNAFKQ
ncbi:hypothetical protein SCP_0214450 [Sparassis crispa]|uniref:UBA domain-containing protein n=1 Tax=Sparassis crispa TaxID=139825 RepID=A0A401GDN1_9APHY|nr:hypothetical protein SCP_0214450 [Sparassis crispa]GBE80235.1 hypothetical protein SCP_0214450 [Sparassis crispa]